MKSRFSYLAVISTILFLSSCTPPGGDAGKGGGGTIQLVFLGLMILVFWMFFIRPQAKRAKNQKTFIEGMGKGDKIVTVAGIHGTIYKTNEDGTLQLEVSPGSYLKIERSAISMDWTAALNKPAPEKK